MKRELTLEASYSLLTATCGCSSSSGMATEAAAGATAAAAVASGARLLDDLDNGMVSGCDCDDAFTRLGADEDLAEALDCVLLS